MKLLYVHIQKIKPKEIKVRGIQEGKSEDNVFFIFLAGEGGGGVSSGMGQKFSGSPSLSSSTTRLQGAVIMTIIIIEWLGVQFHE